MNKPFRKVDTLIENGLVLTMNESELVLTSGSLAIDGAEIVAIGRSSEIAQQYQSDNRVDASGHIVMPGLINTHSHIPMTLFRGLADDVTLDDFLAKLFPMEAALLSPTRVQAGAMLGLIEMVQGGTTCSMDMYWHPESTASAAKKIGARLVAGTVFVDFPGFDGMKTFTERRAHAEQFLTDFAEDELITPGLFPHGGNLLSLAEIELTVELAEKYQCPVQIHASEEAQGVLDIESRLGARPIELFESCGLLSPQLVVAHGIHLNQREIELLAQKKTSVAHCIISNLKLADGIAPIKALTAAGVNVALGTDGPSSSNDLDMWKVMRTASIVQKTANMDPELNPAKEMIQMATINGAKALGMADKIGSLEVGKLADLILIDLRKPHLTPMFDPYSLLLYSVGREDVSSVMINGQWVMRNRQMINVDPFSAIDEVNRIVSSIQ